jgi:Tfp pilus assembly protein PilN
MMTTTTATTTRPGDPLRILAIEANLLPVEIVETRNSRQVRRFVLLGLALAVVLISAWYGQAYRETSSAATAVTATQNDAQRVLRQQQDFSKLVTTRSESDQIRGRLSALLEKDLQWSTIFSSVRSAAPSGVRITGLMGTLSDGAEAGSPAQPATTTDPSVGKLTVNGAGTGKEAVAAYVDALSKVKGLGNPLLNSANEKDGQVTFSVQLDITKTALGGRFTSEED